MKPNRNQSRIWADGMSAEKLSSRENISWINQVLSEEVENVSFTANYEFILWGTDSEV